MMQWLARATAWADHRLTPERRRRFYEIAGAIGGILVVHGVIDADDLAGWLEVLGLALGTVGAPALARAKTP